MTDGGDNASRLKPEEVSAIARAIDVPVYIFGIVPSIDNPSADASTHQAGSTAFEGPLADLAAWTGGHVFVASPLGQRSIAARQLVDELRHPVHLIAFESSGKPGWHPLVVRARNKDLTVRARSGYRGAITPERVLWEDTMFRKFFVAMPIVIMAIGGLDRLRDQEVRAHQRRRSQREGRFAGPR
jgi:hypothetical protein